ncbi:hypothetical protein DV495_003951 [Geotrichum candidum]|uniref:Eukaryotic translation initiation factor 3 subunit D n=1 Tax=Geotrichum candidum TaxID=1173061 RepID=A0A0J9XHZ7_GEOCN|nr:hypothetical protein DV452_001930 [Geotrichum candidum]KAI9211296.1 hypothetical protein DS838_003833 [Geotrichum bryndzae]KAF5124493.1 hypothetical protein DV495_003951 [Geotrichum candidum]KAF7500884.1 hypothetical protein DV113_001093 [Geotrichum candidum]KAI8132407.1 hypothetical protein DUD61_003924 [Geotrichum candidum]
MSFDKIFKLPSFSGNTDPWGPPAAIPESLKFNDVPYAPYSKNDKLGKVADWTESVKDPKDNKRQQQRGYRDPYHAYGANAAASFFNNDEDGDNASFSVVDNTKTRQPTVFKAKGRANNTNARTGGPNTRAPQKPPMGRGDPRNQPRNNPGRKRYPWMDDKPQKNRDASVKVTEEWELIQSNKFNELQKLSFDVPPSTDIGTYGYVSPYNKGLDKPRLNQNLKTLDRTIFNVTTSEDPVIQKLAEENAAKVFATDAIISLLMCTTKSVNPWDIIINKSGDKIFFDKRDGGPLDILSVDENSTDVPADSTDKSNINSAQNLAIEATYINQNFAVNAILENDPKKVKFANPNPFYNPDEEQDPLLAHGYRYKSFNLAESPEDEPINLVVRTEVDAVIPGKIPSFVNVRALNEYGPNGVLEWKNKFANQRGAIVTAEMKKNLCKLSRWTAQSILAGVSSLKIGFVSRQTPKDNTKHIIVGVIGQIPTQLASQINLNISNGWGIVKSIVNIATALDDGKYILMKDPNSPTIMIYRVPANSFESEE